MQITVQLHLMVRPFLFSPLFSCFWSLVKGKSNDPQENESNSTFIGSS